MGLVLICVGGIVYFWVVGIVVVVGGGGFGRGSVVGMRLELGEGVEWKSELILRIGDWESLLELKVSFVLVLEVI